MHSNWKWPSKRISLLCAWVTMQHVFTKLVQLSTHLLVQCAIMSSMCNTFLRSLGVAHWGTTGVLPFFDDSSVFRCKLQRRELILLNSDLLLDRNKVTKLCHSKLCVKWATLSKVSNVVEIVFEGIFWNNASIDRKPKRVKLVQFDQVDRLSLYSSLKSLNE